MTQGIEDLFREAIVKGFAMDDRWSAEGKRAIDGLAADYAQRAATLPAAPAAAGGVEPWATFSLDDIASACTYAEVSDGQYQSLEIALLANAPRRRRAVAAERERLQGQERDAARFRWLRDAAQGEIVFDHTASQRNGGSRFVLNVPFDGEPIEDDADSAARLGEAIDAALASRAGGEGAQHG